MMQRGRNKMDSKIFLFILIAVVAVTGCQKGDPDKYDRNLPGFTSSGNAVVVQSADGTQYDVDCLQANASAIQVQGSSALAECAVGSVNPGTSLDRSRLMIDSQFDE